MTEIVEAVLTRTGACLACDGPLEQTLVGGFVWLPKHCKPECEAVTAARVGVFQQNISDAQEAHRRNNLLSGANLQPQTRRGALTLANIAEQYECARINNGVTPERYREVVQAVTDFVALPPLSRQSGISRIAYIHGTKGTGKSLLLETAVAHVVLKMDLSAVFTSHEDICAQVSRSYNAAEGVSKEETEARIIGNLQTVALLGIDDVGRMTTAKEWAINLLLRVVDERYRQCRPTIVSSNCTVPELYQLWSDANDARTTKLVELLCDRLSDAKAAIMLPMNGKSLRREKAK